MKKQKELYVLLDRDGTVIIDKHYLSDPDDVELLPNAAEGLKKLSELNLGLIIVSNQSGVARGFFKEEQVHKANSRMEEILLEHSIKLDGIYYCPHGPDDGCSCRKPETGMMEKASKELGFNPKDCYVIGDRDSDINLAKNAGCKSVLVRTGKGLKTEEKKTSSPDFTADDLLEAAMMIEKDIADKA